MCDACCVCASYYGGCVHVVPRVALCVCAAWHLFVTYVCMSLMLLGSVCCMHTWHAVMFVCVCSVCTQMCVALQSQMIGVCVLCT